ncbi:chaperone NapD [Paraferrimonas sedimenticola]|uniref:Chaperone NapD n=1 Tax=Paraferrimonas sedimenticola TaxID=375674 RepID=A0AA37W0L1_9GAMM|nr:chaperone NapD [Paraferrimonas sedimenticola]GLP95533.1 sorbose reductase [Paraferrimonas sedimenticola]
MADEYQVTSLVVHCQPDIESKVTERINALAGVEVHATNDQGKLVVTVESESQKGLLDGVEAINKTPGVLSATLVYHQIEPIE